MARDPVQTNHGSPVEKSVCNQSWEIPGSPFFWNGEGLRVSLSFRLAATSPLLLHLGFNSWGPHPALIPAFQMASLFVSKTI